MNRAGQFVDRVLFGPESPARLWFVHAGLAALIGIRIVAGPYRQFVPTPDGLFRPVWFLAWLPGFPSVAVIATLQVVGGAAAIAFVFRKWPRATFATAWVCYLVLAGLRGSRGKILHNDVLLLLTSVPFLAAPLDVDRHDREPARRCGWPVRTSIAVITFAYFFAGYWKLERAGLSWITSDNVRLAVAWGPNPAVPRWDAFANVVTRYGVAGHVIALVTIVFEITAPIALVAPRARIGYALVASTLHVSTYLLLGLDYWAWIGVVWLFFVDWPHVYAKQTARWPAQRSEQGHSPASERPRAGYPGAQ